MNEHVNDRNMNSYEGNGWSKYQLMVLQQLEDHNRVLQNLNREIVDIKQTMAVTSTEAKHWRETTVNTLESVEKKISHVLYDESGIGQKVKRIERNLDVEEQATVKMKAMWAVYGAVAAFIINLIFQVAQFFLKG